MITIEPRDEIEVGSGGDAVAAAATAAEDRTEDVGASPGPDAATLGSRLAARARDAAAAMAWAAVGFAVLGVLWQLVAWRVPELPGPVDTFKELGALLTTTPFAAKGADGSPGIGVQLFGSLQRVFFGFGLAAIIGVPFGFLLGGSKRAWRAANPVIQILRPVSPLAWFPIWLVMLKSAPQAAIWVIFITALWPIVINTAAGASAVPVDQRNVARVFRFGRLAYLRHIVVPHTLPAVITGLRLSMGVAWMVIVAVEMLSGGTGVGFFVWDSYNALNLARVIAAIILIGVIGVVLDQVFLFAGRKATPTEVAS
jgi:nitrate/nitrite transport system permease protein